MGERATISKSAHLAMPLMLLTGVLACDARPPRVSTPDREAKVRAVSPDKAVAALHTTGQHTGDVSVLGSLIAFDPEFRWHNDSTAGHDDGVAPLATFQLLRPKVFRGRQVRLLFKYKRSTAPIIAKTPLKATFSFSLPRGYFAHSKPVPIIDNSLVKQLARSQP